MQRRIAIAVIVLAIAATGAYLTWRRANGAIHYTGVVEGEERVIRSEVTGRVLSVEFGEGDAVPAGAIIARLDDQDIAARLRSKDQSLAVLGAEVRRQEEQVATIERTWAQDVNARRADVRQAGAAADLAEATFKREQELIRTGASTQQLLDEARAAGCSQVLARSAFFADVAAALA
jgi:HlyD family secretion protein